MKLLANKFYMLIIAFRPIFKINNIPVILNKLIRIKTFEFSPVAPFNSFCLFLPYAEICLFFILGAIISTKHMV